MSQRFALANEARRRARISTFASLIPLFAVFAVHSGIRAEDATPAPDGPWISAVEWVGDQIVGTHSQGLLLRPAKLVTTTPDAIDNLTDVGESETSLWTVTSLGEQRFLATDYKGGVHLFKDGSSTKLDIDARWIRALALSPDGETAIAGTEGGKLIVLSLAENQEVKRVDGHAAAVFDIAFNNSGDMVATAAGDGTIKVFSWPDLEVQGEMSRGDEAIWCLGFTHDDKQIVSGGADRRLQLWDVTTARSVCTITNTRDWITDLVVLPDSSAVVASCMDGKLIVGETKAKLKVTEIDAAKSGIWSIDLHNDGLRLALGTRKHGFVVANLDDVAVQAQTVADAAMKVRPPSPTRTKVGNESKSAAAAVESVQ